MSWETGDANDIQFAIELIEKIKETLGRILDRASKDQRRTPCEQEPTSAGCTIVWVKEA